jgi:GH24 family phage-related lysozyme (muramidase)
MSEHSRQYPRVRRETQVEQRLSDELTEVLRNQSLSSFCRLHGIEQSTIHRFVRNGDRSINLTTAGKLAEALGLKLGKPATAPKEPANG